MDRRVAFDTLCRRTHKVLESIARKHLGPTLRRRIDSQDVLQEVFLEAARLLEQLDDAAARKLLAAGLNGANGSGESQLAPDFVRWMAAIISRKVDNLARFHITTEKRNVKREVELDPGAPSAAATDSRRDGKTPSAQLIEKERCEAIERALARLSPRQREVVELVHLRRMRVQEAATRMGKTPASTSVLLYGALRRLAEILRDGRERDD